MENAAGTICIVPITFSPQYPGTRTAQLTVTNGTSTVGTVGLFGIGQGPSVVLSPGGIQAIVGQTGASGSLPMGVTFDGEGNLYFTDFQNNLVEELMPGTGQFQVIAGGGDMVPTTTPIPATAAQLNGPMSVAVDAAGNVYIADFLKHFIERVNKTTQDIVVVAGNNNSSTPPSPTPTPATSVVLTAPGGVAVDPAGNIFIADLARQIICEVSARTGQLFMVAGGGTNVPTATPMPALSVSLDSPNGVTVDSADNIYIADTVENLIEEVYAASGQIVRVAGRTDGQGNAPSNVPTPAIAAALDQPTNVAVDTAGNIYIADYGNNLVEKVSKATNQIVVVAGGGTDTPGSTAISATSALLNNPFALALDSAGNLYLSDLNDGWIDQVSASGFPQIFPSTAVNTVGGPQTITLANIGNAPLNLGSETITGAFTIDGSTTCGPADNVIGGNSCTLSIDFEPSQQGDNSGVLTITDNNLNGISPSQQINLSGVATAATPGTPSVNWPTPKAITYGTALSVTQLNATASFGGKPLAGTFVYSPAAGTVLPAGSNILTATFEPEDMTDYSPITTSVTLIVAQATPTISWATPAPIVPGTALTSVQLDASVSFEGQSVPGTLVYNPGPGFTPSLGADTLSVMFIPDDTVDFTDASGTVVLTVAQAAPTITWNTPAPITYGTPLSSAQLNATASLNGQPLPGTFTYSPAAGVVLTAGNQILTVTFTPLDIKAYSPVVSTVALTVTQVKPFISWSAPSPITYGTALSAAQLDASASIAGQSVAGSFTYLPAIGTVPSAGTQTLSAIFAPEDATDYASASATVVLSVAPGVPTISWPTPAPVTPGTVLGQGQLDATASWGGNPIAGTCTYLPAAGTVLAAGTYTLTCVFTPQDQLDYSTATATVVLAVEGTDLSVTPSVSAQTIGPGGLVTYAFTIVPTDPSGRFVNDINFAVTGIPSGWPSPIFSPPMIAAGANGTQTVKMTIEAGNQAARNADGFPRRTLRGVLALLLLPWLARRGMVRRMSIASRLLVLVVASFCVAITVSGCGSGTPSAPRTYTLVMTATSGETTISTPVTLVVN